MKKVQIPVAVPEPCSKGRVGVAEQVPVVTRKTELIFGVGIGHIGIGGKFFHQEMCIQGAVRIMTGRAFAVLADRSMQDFHGLLDDILVTLEAEVLALLQQEFIVLACVGGMTRRTALLRLDRCMDCLGLFDLFADLGMTLEAELRAFGGKQLSIGCAMRVVTGRAAPQQRGMHVFLFHLIVHIEVAGDAQSGRFLYKQGLIVRFMGVVARRTISCRCRTMEVLGRKLVSVTGQTKVFQGLCEELRFVRRVRIMARGAHSIFHRRMDVFLCSEGLVAHAAQTGDLLNEPKRSLALLRMGGGKRLMAALTHLRYGMYGLCGKE